MKILKLEMKIECLEDSMHFIDPSNGASLCQEDLCRLWGLPKGVREIDVSVSDVPKRGYVPIVMGSNRNWLRFPYLLCYITEDENGVDEFLSDPGEVNSKKFISFVNMMKVVFENHFGIISVGDKKVFYVRIMV